MAKVSVFVRSPYNYDVDLASEESGLLCQDESRTQQSFKEETDINEIVRRFGLTGEMPTDVRMPQSGDFTNVTDYKSAMDLLLSAQNEFMRLPAEVRDRFANDPGRLIAFLEDDKNREEAAKLGLLKSPPPRDAVQAIDELAKAVQSAGAKAAT